MSTTHLPNDDVGMELLNRDPQAPDKGSHILNDGRGLCLIDVNRVVVRSVGGDIKTVIAAACFRQIKHRVSTEKR